MRQAFTEGAVADLIVVLQKQYKSRRRQVRAGFASRVPVTRRFALIDKPFAEQARKLLRRLFGEVGVVGVGFTGQQHVEGVVPVVVPLSIETLFQKTGLVELILKVQPHVAAWFNAATNPLCELRQEGLVANGMNSVHAQAVEAVLEQPHQGVIDEKVAHLRASEVDRIAPWGVQVAAEKLFGVTAQVVAVRTEVVVHHIENHHQAKTVGSVDQMLELFRRAVGGLRSVMQNAIVAPVAITGELRKRHQFDCGNAQFGESRQVFFHASIATHGAHVQFVDNRFMPWTPVPRSVLP